MTMSRANPNALASGAAIRGYTVHNILGQGGFGITYLAHDMNLRHLVAIKEYLPTDLAGRNASGEIVPLTNDHREEFAWGLQRFISEAQILSKFKHPNIVSVMSVFEMHGTAYMVMRYEEGSSLAEILKGGATLDENWLKKMILPILDGLKIVHAAGFIHRDIKPGNIYIRNDQSPVLLDFGSARQTGGVATRTLTTLVSPGYAPFEQYYARSNKQGPWTDIYALGATLYRATIGSVPCDAIARSEALLSGTEDLYKPAIHAAAKRFSIEFLSAIDRALSFREDERPRDLAGWTRELEGDLFVFESIGIRTKIDGVHKPTVAADPRTQRPAPARTELRMARVLPAAIPIAVAVGFAAWVTAYQPPDYIVNEAPFAAIVAANPVSAARPVALVGTEVDRLTREAWDDLGEGRFVGSGNDNALARLRRVLEIDPDNNKARSAMGALHTYFLRLAQRAVDEGNGSRAVAHARHAAMTATTDDETAAARRLLFSLRRIAQR
ncbi:MAG: serine/threonine protein kinase [Proteobacteria bacterium]|nr:MAG: serine/threonine protein kinase [Pseudomonadota bacterium]